MQIWSNALLLNSARSHAKQQTKNEIKKIKKEKFDIGNLSDM